MTASADLSRTGDRSDGRSTNRPRQSPSGQNIVAPFTPSANGDGQAAPFTPSANGDSERTPDEQHVGRIGNPSYGVENDGADTKTTDAPPAKDGYARDVQGRFAKGNRGGPGNPFARRLAALRRTLLSYVSEDDIQNAARRLTEEARRGDLAAIKLLFAYVIGRPSEAVDPDTVDHQELDLYRQGQARMADILGILNNLPPDMACQIVRQVLPYAAEDVARRLMHFLELQTPGAAKA